MRSEYRRMRVTAKELAKHNKPPFKVVRESVAGEAQGNWRDLLELMKTEGMKGVDLQRYKGLGEMNANQLWETTMNAEVRTLLDADGRGRREPAEVHRRERAGRAQPGRVE